MKQFILILGLLGFSMSTYAQDRTLLGNNNRFGIFVSPLIEAGPIAGERENQFGGGLAFVLGNGFIGAYSTAAVDLQPILDNGIGPDRIDMAQAGLWLGWTPGQNSLIHPVFELRTGFAAIDFDYHDFDDPFFDPYDDVDNAFVLQPAAGLELNIARFMRVNFNAGYRWTEGVNQPGLSDDDFSGWTYTLGVKLGFFGRDRRHHRTRYW